MHQNNADKHFNYYLEVINQCKSCDLYSELDDYCLIEESTIMDIVKSKVPMCPIGNW